MLKKKWEKDKQIELKFLKNWIQWSFEKKAISIWLVFVCIFSLIIPLLDVIMVFSFLGIPIFLVLAIFKRKSTKKLLLSALGLFVLFMVSGQYVEPSNLEESKQEEVAVIESETEDIEEAIKQNNETNANETINKPSKVIYNQNEWINQWVNNLNELHELSLTSDDVKEGAMKSKASLSLDKVHIMLSDTSEKFFMDFSQESLDSSDELFWEAFRKGFSAIGSGLTSQEFNELVSMLKAEEDQNKDYGKVSIQGHEFTYITQSLNAGGIRYTLKCNFKKENIFKSILVDYQLELSTNEKADEMVESNSSQSTTEVVTQTSSTKTTIHFIETGNSDSILIENSGKFALIDAGDRDDDAKIKTYLKNQGVSRLEYLIITHFHADHFGGADTVVNDFEVGTTFVPNGSADTQVYRDFINALSNKGLKPSVPLENAVISLGEATLTFYNTKGQQSNPNNNSLVTLLESGSRKALFTGDAESQIESMLTQIGKVDVFKAGHHGSSTSNTSALLNQIKPDHVVVMVGANNKYGHPDSEAMNRFKDLNIPVYRTDEQGTIVVTLDDEGVSVSQKPGSYQAGSSSSSSSNSSTTSSNSNNSGVSSQTATESATTTNNQSNTSTPSTSTGTKDDNPNGTYNQTSSEPKQSFKNCTLLREVYPDGVPEGHAAYESKHDRDKDGWACER